MGHPARHRLARAAAYAAVTVAFAAGIAGYQEHADRQLRRNQVEACERGNRLQASFNLFVREAVRVRRASGLAGRDSALPHPPAPSRRAQERSTSPTVSP